MPRRTAGAPPREAPVRPILKWAGGKRQLLPTLRRFYPETFDRYIEPFVGSGAVFLDLHNRGLLDGREVRLSDVNADVIGCYRMVRDAVEDVIPVLQTLEAGHRADSREHFYEVRDGRFNPLRHEIHSSGSAADRYTPGLAAMLVYLNRTGYNGLFRVNSKGRFNVPVGRHGAIRICDADNLRRLSHALKRPGLTLEVQLFEHALTAVRAGDFVYLDPPYAPVSRTSYFTSYSTGRFGLEEQTMLQQAVIAMASRGAHVLLSNSVAPDIRMLYEESAAVRDAGFLARTVEARRAINSRATARGAVLEYLISNVEPHGER
jgi:DNA adenine methylase